MTVLVPDFREASRMIPNVVALVSTSCVVETNSGKNSPFTTSVSAFVVICIPDDGHSGWCEMQS